MSQDTPVGGHQGRPAADGSARLAPPWAAVAATVAVLITGGIGALVWRSERLGSIDAWALREFGAHSYREFQLASGVAASLRPVAICGTMAIAVLAWVALRRWNGVILSLAAPAVTFAVEKLLKHLVARRSPGVSVFLYPSGHLAVATALALTLILVVRNSGARPNIRVSVIACASLFVLVMAKARLAETAHSLSDVVGGVATGAAVTLAAALLLDLGLLRFMSHKRTQRQKARARRAVVGPRDSGQQRSITVSHGQPNLQLVSRNRP